MRTDGMFRSNRERRAIRLKIKNVKGNNLTNILPDSLAWDAMIRDAKKRIEDLKFSIELFEKKKAAGERWPGAPSGAQGAAQRHAVSGTAQFPAS
jgi:hypothetical protein